MPNNRQLAVLIWAAIALTFMVAKPELRRSMGNVIRTLGKPVLLVPILLYLGNIALALLAARWAGLWTSDLATDTVFWAATSGAVLFAGFPDASDRPDFFTTKARQVLGVTILVELLLAVAVLPLVAELALIPVVVSLTGVEVVGRQKQEHARVVKLANGCLSTLGLLLLGYALFLIAFDAAGIDWPSVGKQVLLPVWLTISVLPYIYALGVYARYESLFHTLDWQSKKSWRHRSVAKAALVREFGARGHELGQFKGVSLFNLAQAESWSQSRSAIREQQEVLKEEGEAEDAKAERLQQHAGVDGVDGEGLRLDRREFQETIKGLEWLHTCHMGWWRKDQRYVAGLLDRIGSPKQLHGLEPKAGYHEFVTDDGQAWYGWRRTITGWVFAIGADAQPPNEWRFDGPEPPSGPPGEDAVWGDDPFSDEANRELVARIVGFQTRLRPR